MKVSSGGVYIDSTMGRSEKGYISVMKAAFGGVYVDSTKGWSGEGYISGIKRRL
jgi:hypothetical protein